MNWRTHSCDAEGMVYVLVSGVPVVRDGSLVEGVAPGPRVAAVTPEPRHVYR